MEGIITLCYKFGMFGVPIDGPVDILCVNKNVVDNTTNVDYKLNKKHISLEYHAIYWSNVANILRLGKVYTSENISDPYTQLLPVYEHGHRVGNSTYY